MFFNFDQIYFISHISSHVQNPLVTHLTPWLLTYLFYFTNQNHFFIYCDWHWEFASTIWFWVSNLPYFCFVCTVWSVTFPHILHCFFSDMELPCPFNYLCFGNQIFNGHFLNLSLSFFFDSSQHLYKKNIMQCLPISFCTISF